MELIKFQIYGIDLENTSKPNIYIKQVGSHRKRILSYIPNESNIEKLLLIFKVKTLQELKNKIFQVPKEKSQTDLAFEFILDQGHP